MATVQTLDKIRTTLKQHLGKTIVLKANKGRKQIVTKVGVLENVYPSVFVVKLDGTSDGNQRVSYSYSDLLTANVKLQICKNKENKLSAAKEQFAARFASLNSFQDSRAGIHLSP